MKIIALVNESFDQMALGSNTTLAYILAAVKQNHDVYIYQFTDEKIPTISSKIKTIHLNKNNASALIFQYQEANKNFHEAKKFPVKIAANTEISLDEIDFVIQRLEPMKAPFPPVGKVDINEFLAHLQKIFPANFIFNSPANCYGDKEFPLLFNFATPTEISFFDDNNLVEKLHKISNNIRKKIVIKPNDSAQAYGVFSVEFLEKGLDLQALLALKISNLTATQSYQINPSSNLEEIIKILLFVQFYKTKKLAEDKIIASFSDDEIKRGALMLYDKKILFQPFLEGVKLGDIRIILAKMSDGNFQIIGAIFRKIFLTDEKNFTTGFMSGRSTPEPIESCTTLAERKNLQVQIAEILQKLNGELKEKYKNSTEIGCDFILAGNGQDVYFGEANHHCQGLIPLAEIVQSKNYANSFFEQINGLKISYDDGLALTGAVIEQQIMLQKK